MQNPGDFELVEILIPQQTAGERVEYAQDLHGVRIQELDPLDHGV